MSFDHNSISRTAAQRRDRSPSKTVIARWLSNYAVNATHTAVTARAYCGTRRAVWRARYRGR
jgi:hypothetical protein